MPMLRSLRSIGRSSNAPGASTGRIFPTDVLREQGREFVARIDEQVAENGELAKLVGTLEERHDSYMEGTTLRSPLTDEDGELPSADEIAAELADLRAEIVALRAGLRPQGS